MPIYLIILGAALILLAVALTILVLLQDSKRTGLTSVISGNTANNAKRKTMDKDKKLSKITTVLAIVFAVLVLATYLLV